MIVPGIRENLLFYHRGASFFIDLSDEVIACLANGRTRSFTRIDLTGNVVFDIRDIIELIDRTLSRC